MGISQYVNASGAPIKADSFTIGNILLNVNSQFECNFVICDFGYADFTKDAGRQLVAGMKKPSTMG